MAEFWPDGEPNVAASIPDQIATWRQEADVWLARMTVPIHDPRRVSDTAWIRGAALRYCAAQMECLYEKHVLELIKEKALLILQSARPDPAEAHPDPDHGF